MRNRQMAAKKNSSLLISEIRRKVWDYHEQNIFKLNKKFYSGFCLSTFCSDFQHLRMKVGKFKNTFDNVFDKLVDSVNILVLNYFKLTKNELVL